MQPHASLSIDLDNKWSYLKTHGDAGWQQFPSYLNLVVPRFLDLLDEHKLKITVFVVGQDAVLDRNRNPLESIAGRGHEIGNHSFHHEPWLHLYSEGQIEEEIGRATEAIETVTGRRAIGFRGPGFSVSNPVLNVLARSGYLYDASTFPTFLGPLARFYYFLTAKLTPEEKQQRKQLFGGIREGRRPLRPYRWHQNGSLLEIPVTTLPGVRVPFHLSYVLYLCCYSVRLGIGYFHAALALCRAFRVNPSVLLHPLDFLSIEECPELAFFPAMRLPAKTKLRVVAECLLAMRQQFRVVPLEEHARLSALTDLAVLSF